MPLREDFFDNPTFRATPTKALNDPFETDIQQYQMENIINHWIEEGDRYSLKDTDKILKGGRESEIKYEKQRFEEEIEKLGVISFTEDYTNLLMWAHYANEHKGIVVKISNEVSWFTNTAYHQKGHSGPRRFRYDWESIIDEMPQRVIYRNDRPLFESATDVADTFDIRILKSIIQSKGDNWIHEKEHRSIVPLENADIIYTKYTKNLITEIGSSPYVIVSKSLDNYSAPIINEKCYITFTSPNNPKHMISDFEKTFEPKELEEIRMNLYYHYKYNSDEALFFYRINTMFISEIYFGCKCSEKTVQKMVKKIRSNKVFNSNILLKQAVISKEKYALDFVTL